MILEQINSPEDLKAIPTELLPQLCEELRSFVISHVAETGGHLASNLGVVELTVAIHRVFDTKSDRLVFDVGHQSYIHKILTGRRDEFSSIRQYGGISGFPKPAESVHDAFIAGHASNSISVALGMARARTLSRKEYNVIALLGDGALTGGLSYEALSDAGDSEEPLIVILNDNGMSITRNVGGISRYLAHQRLKPGYHNFKKAYKRFMDAIPGGKAIYRFNHRIKTVFKEAILNCSMFEDMGFQYYGPVDGHDIAKLSDVLTWARDAGKPVLVHVTTKKGKGYALSEGNPDKYHGVKPFNPKRGLDKSSALSFSAVFGETMIQLAEKDVRVCAVTAAMESGTGLTHFAQQFPNRFFDVGIAEGHAVAMAAGAAKQGSIPVVAIYSTFLQRSYDMLIHDVALSKLHVVFAVDRAGIVPEDGETHQGVFDVAYLSSVPGLTVLAPSNYSELKEMLELAVLDMDGPVAVRYPRGREGKYIGHGFERTKLLKKGSDISIISYGIMINTAIDVAAELAEKGISAELIKLGQVAPIDMTEIIRSAEKTGRVIVIEDTIAQGGAGQRIAANLMLAGANAKVVLKNIGESFLPGGSEEELKKHCGLDEISITDTIMKEFHFE